MKIAHLYCYPGGGGSEAYGYYLASEAKKAGHEVVFVFGGDGPLCQKVSRGGFRTVIIKMPSFYNPFSILKLRSFLKEEGIEIVHTHFLREHFLAVITKILGARIKVVRTFHREDRFYRKVRPFMGIFQLKTDAFIAISEYLKERMIKEGIRREKITLVHNGVPEVKVEKGDKGIGYLGRISAEKGILSFVFENAELIKAKLIIAGDGPELEAAKRAARGNKLIEFMGQVDDRIDFFKKVSVLILPSETEVMPLSLLEAFSAGVPVVAFDLEPLREFVNKDNGVLVEKGNYKKLYQEAEKLAVSGRVLGKNAKKDWENNYSIDKMWQKTESLYKSLLD